MGGSLAAAAPSGSVIARIARSIVVPAGATVTVVAKVRIAARLGNSVNYAAIASPIDMVFANGTGCGVTDRSSTSSGSDFSGFTIAGSTVSTMSLATTSVVLAPGTVATITATVNRDASSCSVDLGTAAGGGGYTSANLAVNRVGILARAGIEVQWVLVHAM